MNTIQNKLLFVELRFYFKHKIKDFIQNQRINLVKIQILKQCLLNIKHFQHQSFRLLDYCKKEKGSFFLKNHLIIY